MRSSMDLIPVEILEAHGLVDGDPREVFIEDEVDATWGSLVYHADSNILAIYLDGRELGVGYEKCMVSLATTPETLMLAVGEALMKGKGQG